MEFPPCIKFQFAATFFTCFISDKYYFMVGFIASIPASIALVVIGKCHLINLQVALIAI